MRKEINIGIKAGKKKGEGINEAFDICQRLQVSVEGVCG